MDLATAFGNINWASVIVAAIVCFLIGGLWYGPLFGRAWMQEFGFTEDDLKARNIPKTFGLSLILCIVAALILDMFIGAQADITFGIAAGFFAGIGWVATMLGVLYLFEMQSLRAYLINAGYCVLALTAIGAIVGAW